MKALYLLYENAQGYALLEAAGLDEIGATSEGVQKSVTDLARFSKVVKITGFKGYGKATVALDQVNSISESLLTSELQTFLQTNLPSVKAGKKPAWQLGVADPKLGSAIQETTGVPCVCNEMTGELLRGVRAHEARLLKQFLASTTGSVEQGLHVSQLSLAHAYSRSKVKFNVNRVDNMIIQAIALLDTLDKDVNTFVMRVREWYSWHFPELVKLAADNYQYARLALAIKDKSSLSEDSLPALTDIVGDEEKAAEILEAAKSSMGQDISPIDLINIEAFAKRVIALAEYRAGLALYLQDKMHSVAPNLSALIGEVVGARLISHAGSLTNLAKYPASTVQILGAEKALFRALKTRGNTPKYGLIFHSSFIGRAKQRDKGRISRYLANKCSIASRIDCFSDVSTSLFGEKLKEQVEERLRFYEEGIAPGKNSTAMEEALEKVRAEGGDAHEANGDIGEKKKKKKKDKKRAAEEEEVVVANGHVEEAASKKKKKKAAAAAEAEPEPEVPKKKKKKSKE